MDKDKNSVNLDSLIQNKNELAKIKENFKINLCINNSFLKNMEKTMKPKPIIENEFNTNNYEFNNANFPSVELPHIEITPIEDSIQKAQEPMVKELKNQNELLTNQNKELIKSNNIKEREIEESNKELKKSYRFNVFTIIISIISLIVAIIGIIK